MFTGAWHGYEDSHIGSRHFDLYNFSHLSRVGVIRQRVKQRLQFIPAAPAQDKPGPGLMEEMGTLWTDGGGDREDTYYVHFVTSLKGLFGNYCKMHIEKPMGRCFTHSQDSYCPVYSFNATLSKPAADCIISYFQQDLSRPISQNVNQLL